MDESGTIVMRYVAGRESTWALLSIDGDVEAAGSELSAIGSAHPDDVIGMMPRDSQPGELWEWRGVASYGVDETTMHGAWTRIDSIADLTRQLAEQEAMLNDIQTALGHAGENVGERLVALEAEVSRYQGELLDALRERDEARALLAERKWNPTEHPQ